MLKLPKNDSFNLKCKVLERAQKEFLNYDNIGTSVMGNLNIVYLTILSRCKLLLIF